MTENGKKRAYPYIRINLLPVFDSIFLPYERGGFIPREFYEAAALEKASNSNLLIGLYRARHGIDSEQIENELTGTKEERDTIGILCNINKFNIGPVEVNGRLFPGYPLFGQERFRLIKVLSYQESGHIHYPAEAEIDIIREKNIGLHFLDQKLLKNCIDLIEKIKSLHATRYASALPQTDEIKNFNVGQLADRIAAWLDFESIEEKFQFLETLDPILRFRKAVEMLIRTLERVAQVPVHHYPAERTGIGTGHRNEENQEIKNLRERFNKIKGRFSEADEKYVLRVLNKLANTPTQSSDHAVESKWLETAISLAELEASEECKDIGKISRILDEDHYGLKEIKERIAEDVAVRILNPGLKGSILCFVGPPGVGKTSLGKSIARALGRKFVQWSAGGVRDEAEIRGHRRTYIGAKPGRIIEALINSGSSNPLFMIDEIDKLGQDFRGDPSSALLEVLDPEQNHRFSDHYMEISANLSKILFIVTANTTEPIPPALRDRLEILRLPGYAEEEKMEIAKEFLIPKQLREKGLAERILTVKFEDEALRQIIRGYTEEAGVRNLEREIAKIIRKLVKQIAEKTLAINIFEITAPVLAQFLGAAKFIWDRVSRNLAPGVANGLAWTEHGGKVLQIQFRKQKGTGQITLTGSLGEVMKESAMVARSLLRSRIHTDEDEKLKDDFHFHAPEGATPKEGPSAGVTFFVAGYSGLKNIAVKDSLAMTGEVDLTGNVLPVGGIPEKITGGERKGIREFILPEANRPDVDNLPQDLKIKKMILEEKITIHFVRTVEEVLDIAFPERKKESGKTSV